MVDFLKLLTHGKLPSKIKGKPPFGRIFFLIFFFEASNKQIRGQEEKLRYMAERGCKASAAILAQMEAFRAMYGKNGTE